MSPFRICLLSGLISQGTSALRVHLLRGSSPLKVHLLLEFVSFGGMSVRKYLLGVCPLRVLLFLEYFSSQGMSPLGVHLLSGYIFFWGSSLLRIHLSGYIFSQGTSLGGLSPLRVRLFSGYISSWGSSPLGYIYQSTSHWGYLSCAAHPPKTFLAAPFCPSPCSSQFLPPFPQLELRDPGSGAETWVPTYRLHDQLSFPF